MAGKWEFKVPEPHVCDPPQHCELPPIGSLWRCAGCGRLYAVVSDHYGRRLGRATRRRQRKAREMYKRTHCGATPPWEAETS